MAQTVEFDLAKFLEDFRQELKETNRKIEKISEGQIRLEGKIETLNVEVKTLQTGQDTINSKLNTQNTWLLSLLTALVVGILGLVAAVGRVVFFANP